MLPLPAGSDRGSAQWWKTQLDWAAEIRRDLLPTWRGHANAYRDKLDPPLGLPRGMAIRVNIEFEKTEQKKYQLFFRNPALKLRAHPRTLRDALDPQTGQPTRDLKKAIAIFKEYLAYLAGAKGANLAAVMSELLFDVLCPAGIGFAKVGYERVEDGKVPMQIGMQPDPNFQQPGAVLNISLVPPQVPQMGEAPNIVFERYFVSRISPAQGLIPAEFRGSDYERDADWLGHDFPIAIEDAKAKGWQMPSDLKSSLTDSVNDDEDRIVPLDKKGTRKGQLRCREIYYYASRVDAKVKHPEKLRRLVFITGQPEPVVHEDLTHQKWDARGRLIGGMRTNPIRVLTLRYVSDLAYPPSDCAITRRASDELSEFRTQQVVHRRKSVPMEWINIEAVIDDKVKKKLQDGDDYYGKIPVDQPGNQVMGAIERPPYPNDNWRTEDAIMGQVNRAWALGANQSSVTEPGSTTATEISAIAQATATRLGGEREIVIQKFWVGIMEQLGALVQLYADREDYVEIVGEDGSRAIEAWDKETIKGEFLYEVVPNSAMQPDATADRDLALNRYNLLANDPFSNREQLVRDTYQEYDSDPDRLVKAPEPPPPDKPKVNVAINGKDLDPTSPQYPNVVNLLKAAGMPEMLPAAQAGMSPPTGEPPEGETGPAGVVDRERLRMALADNVDQRAPQPGGLVQ